MRWRSVPPGPIATRAFGAYLTNIFTNPSVRFRIVDEKGASLSAIRGRPFAVVPIPNLSKENQNELLAYGEITITRMCGKFSGEQPQG